MEIHSNYDGPWQVGCKNMHWYVVNTSVQRKRPMKRIGPVQLTGRNYCDEARAEAERRNASLRMPSRKQSQEKRGPTIPDKNQVYRVTRDGIVLHSSIDRSDVTIFYSARIKSKKGHIQFWVNDTLLKERIA